MTDGARARINWIAGLCLVCSLMIAVQAWKARFFMDPDGLSYLDMADRLDHGDLSPLVHPYWSPLYPSILAVTFKIFPSAAMEFEAAHLVNFLIGLLALAAFTFFLMQWFRSQAASRGEESAASFRCRTGLAYALFLLGTLEAINLSTVSPDLSVAALVYLAAGLCFRLAAGFGSQVTFAFLGIVLAIACLTKAAMVPLSVVLLLLLAMPWFSGRWRRSYLAISVLCFLVIVGPYVLAMSRRQHHLTFGESGKLNYAWSVQGGIPMFAGWSSAVANVGTPLHPPRLINNDPPILEFENTAPGTFPLWYDPVYFHQGLQIKFSARKQISAILKNLKGFRWASGYSLYPLLAGLVILVCVTSPRRIWMNLSPPLLLIWSLAAFGQYALVAVLPRYIAPFTVLFWLALYEACSPGRLKAMARGAVGATAVSILFFQMLGLFKTGGDLPEGVRPDASLAVADELERLGLREGDEIATVGSGFEAYYAQLSRVRVGATIGYRGGALLNDEKLPAFSATDLSEIVDKLRPLHIKAIVSRQAQAVAGNSWDCVAGTGYCVLLIKPL